MITTLIILILSYLVGSFPSALILGKRFHAVDIREHGSKNLGTTNTVRVLGKRIGFAVLVLDVSKGALAASLPIFFGSDLNILITGGISLLGHAYPIFANFKGGKAVATTLGVLMVYNATIVPISLVVFIIVLLIFKYVSLASIISILAVVTTTYFTNEVIDCFIWLLIAMFIIFKHKNNIQRIINFTEPAVNLKKNK